MDVRGLNHRKDPGGCRFRCRAGSSFPGGLALRDHQRPARFSFGRLLPPPARKRFYRAASWHFASGSKSDLARSDPEHRLEDPLGRDIP